MTEQWIETMTQGIYGACYGHLDDKQFADEKMSEIADWLREGDIRDDDLPTQPALIEEWREYDAAEIAANVAQLAAKRDALLAERRDLLNRGYSAREDFDWAGERIEEIDAEIARLRTVGAAMTTERRAPLTRTHHGIVATEVPTAPVQPGGFDLLTYMDSITGFEPGRHLWAFEADGVAWLVDERVGAETVSLYRAGSGVRAECDSLDDAVAFTLSIR